MPTEDVLVSLDMNFGMNTENSEKLTVEPQLLQNCTLGGKNRYKKRKGFTSLVKTAVDQDLNSLSNISEAVWGYSFNDVLTLRDNRGIFKYSDNLAKWVREKQLTPIELDVGIKSRVSDLTGATAPSIVGVVSSYRVHVFMVAGYKFKYVVYDNSTNEPLSAFITVTGSATTRIDKTAFLVNENSYLTLVIGDPDSATQIVAYRFNTSTLRFGAATTLQTGVLLGTSANFFSVDVDANGIVLAYVDSVNDLNIRRYDSALASLGVQNFAGTYKKVDLRYDSGNTRYLAYGVRDNGGTLEIYVIDHQVGGSDYTKTTAKSVSTLDNHNVCGIISGTSIVFFIEEVDLSGTPDERIIRKFSYTIGSDSAISSPTTITRDYSLLTSPIIWNSTIYLALSRDVLSTNQAFEDYGVSCWIDSDGEFHGFFGHNIYPITPLTSANSSCIPRRSYFNSNIAHIDFPDSQTGIGSVGSEGTTHIYHKFTFGTINTPSVARLSENFYISGMMPLEFDGRKFFDMCFGEVVFGTVSTSAAGSTYSYNYALVAKYIDSRGNVHRSTPVIISITSSSVVGTATHTVKFTPIRYSLKETIDIEIYRTINNGNEYYLLTQILNDNSQTTISYADTTTDSNLTASGTQQLYTNGENLENEASSYKYLRTHQRRIFGIRYYSTNIADYTKKEEFGVPARFNRLFNTPMTSDDGGLPSDLKAMASTQNALIYLKGNSIYALNGDGADATGQGETFGEPYQISQGVGIKDAASAVETPNGVMFNSEKGFYVVSNSLELVKISGIEDYLSLTITSATLRKDLNQVWWTTSDGQALVYDYENVNERGIGKWSIMENYTAIAGFYRNSKFVHILADGTVNIENATFDDNGSFIPIKIKSGWAKLNGIQNYQRLKRVFFVGDWKSNHNLKLSIAYNYEQYDWEDHTYSPFVSGYNVTSKPTDAALEAGGNTGVYNIDYHIKRQKCSAFQFTIEDVYTDTNGESLTLDNITLLIGKKKGAAKYNGGSRS